MIQSTMMADNTGNKGKVSIDISRLDGTTKPFDLLQERNFLLLVLIISCEADGSVHRDVRKLTRQITASGETSELGRLQNNHRIVVVLLGHAICHNSANQMESEIFRVGRKLAKLLGAETGKGTLLETQVELESPQVSFDAFMQKHGREILLLASK